MSFNNLDAILKQLVSLIDEKAQNANTLENNQEGYTKLKDNIILHRDIIKKTMDKLINRSTELNYKLGNSLYTPVLNLRNVLDPLIVLLKSNKLISELFPKPQRNEKNLYDVLIKCMENIYYLPRIVYETLGDMELSQQMDDKENQQPNSVSYINFGSSRN